MQQSHNFRLPLHSQTARRRGEYSCASAATRQLFLLRSPRTGARYLETHVRCTSTVARFSKVRIYGTNHVILAVLPCLLRGTNLQFSFLRCYFLSPLQSSVYDHADVRPPPHRLYIFYCTFLTIKVYMQQ